MIHRIMHCISRMILDENKILLMNLRKVYTITLSKALSRLNDIIIALLINPEQPTLHKNLGAMEASRGNYTIAMNNVNQALLLNDRDPVNLRNYAKLRDALGDTRVAYQHNVAAIALETQQHTAHPNTKCYRAAAIQNITLGGDHNSSLSFMNTARKYEHKKITDFEFVSLRRTDELINAISHRKAQPMEVLEKMLKTQAEHRELENAVKKGDISTILRHRAPSYK
jgi:tetratricopeptide (TPR) repeat protein